MGSNEKFNEALTPLTDKLGAVVGASRAAAIHCLRHPRGHPALGGHEGA
jgi:hypothetical protein